MRLACTPAQVVLERGSAKEHGAEQSTQQKGATQARSAARDGEEEDAEVEVRCDSAYLPRVTPLAVMAPISDDRSCRLSLQVPASLHSPPQQPQGASHASVSGGSMHRRPARMMRGAAKMNERGLTSLPEEGQLQR